MRLLETIIKSAIILGTVLLMLSPLFMERLVFKLDEKRKSDAAAVLAKDASVMEKL